MLLSTYQRAFLFGAACLVVAAISIQQFAVLREARRRYGPVSTLFPEQLATLRDPAKCKAIWTTRQAGKTHVALVDFIEDSRTHPYAQYRFIAQTYQSVEDIAWPVLHQINREFRLGMRFQEQKLRAIMPNGAQIRLYGADRPGWASKIYGQVLRRVYIDEAAFFTVSLYDIYEDYIQPALMKEEGQFWIMSIPGHLPRGIFDDCIKCFDPVDKISGVKCENGPRYHKFKWKHDRPTGFSVHRWTTAENPATNRQYFAQIEKAKAKNPDIEEDPRFQRNYRGLRVTEMGEMVYKFNPEKNTFHADGWKCRAGDHYIIGLDFGYDDRTAFVVLVWREDLPYLVEIESFRLEEAILGPIYAHHRTLLDQYDVPGTDIITVADHAHKHLFEAYRQRFDLDVICAEKENKFDWIAIYNASLAAGDIKFINPADSPHVEEMYSLKWRKNQRGMLEETPGQFNDACDAGMIGFRHSYHYLWEEEEQGPPTNAELRRQEIERLRQEDLAGQEHWG